MKTPFRDFKLSLVHRTGEYFGTGIVKISVVFKINSDDIIF